MTAMLFDHLGQPVTLGAKIGTGGEGAVFEISGAPNLVAKIYHKPPPGEKAMKLQAMVSIAKKEIMEVAAWPTAILHNGKGGPAAGLVMRRIKDYKEVHTLYSPAHRKTTFPAADWEFLIHVAANCAAAFHALHEANIVIGDVNQSNVMVSEQGFIGLIDCDSFQVQYGTKTFSCEVGVPLFTPPELQGQSFRGITRTTNHDLFGLAVLIFHLLFMGRHPFAGRFAGQGDMPIEKSIQEFRFAYGQDAQKMLMQPPLHALPLDVVSPPLAGFFERAFSPGATAVGARPSSSEWYHALKAFMATLQPCPQDRGHLIPSHRSTCPWCDLMKQGAPNFFVSVSFARMSQGSVFVLATVWAKIDQVPRPGAFYSRPAIPLVPAATPWPAHLPTVLPGKPLQPTILTHPPKLPPLQLPPRKHRMVELPRSSTQTVTSIMALVSVPLIFPVAIAGALVGHLALGQFWLSAILFGVLSGCFTVALVIRWGWLEFMRWKEEHELNQEYFEEEKQRKREILSHRLTWEEQLASQQAEARRQYGAAHDQWQAIANAMNAEANKRRQKVKELWGAVESAEQRWLAASRQMTEEFDRKKKELQQLRDRHHQFAGEYASQYQELLAKTKEMQRDLFLQQYFISDHDIRGFGPTLKATLLSYGIETAFDIEEEQVSSVPGFGEKRTGQLLSWRATIEAKFVFNAALGVPPGEQQALNLKCFQARQPIEAKLLNGENELMEITQRYNAGHRAVSQEVTETIARFARATADTMAIPKGI